MDSRVKFGVIFIFTGLTGVMVIGFKIPPAVTICEYYNKTQCGENDKGIGCNSTERECEVQDMNKKAHCFALWSNKSDGSIEFRMKGCFIENGDCTGHKRCVDLRENPRPDLMFCCCERNLCNHDVFWEPSATQAPPVSKNDEIEDISSQINPLLMVLLPIIVFSIIVSFFYYFFRKKKSSYFNEVPTADPSNPLPPPTPNGGHRPIQLLEVKAKGRFGAVWKAQLRTEVIAVKIFPIQDKQSWQTEQQIYNLPQIRHESILQYMGAEKHGENLQSEFWLITAYHEHGSLCDYLKANTLTWLELCRIAESMARGLMHLHEELTPSKAESFKPAVAHRDFKSKNVLLKADLTACVADFGLALVFQPGKPCGDTHGQVGTRRYMAPEVLEGAIIFSRDHFLRIDMYACGLVLWELASRCTAQDGPVPEYQLPFEEEVGQHPTLEDMQECVVNKKQRPILSTSWKTHPGLLGLCDTMEECWDQDAEARLSASCVMERIASQSRLTSQTIIMNESNL